MLKKKTLALTVLLLGSVFAINAQQKPQQTASSPEELAEQETERLESLLKLEDWQVFYVDSTLRHNYSETVAELQAMQKALVSNYDLYTAVKDKWMEKTENSYRKIFTDAQWKRYLKTGGERIIREREKRQEKTRKANEQVKNDTREH